jgi:lincosamide nucleotidyltransferase A/C/D/E
MGTPWRHGARSGLAGSTAGSRDPADTVDVRSTSGPEVLRILDALAVDGIAAGITGGWGIDALLGRQTRTHGDVDLGIAAERVDDALRVLDGLGYAVTADERPARIALVGARGGVDVHPIEFSPTGSGTQTGFDGQRFEYPPGSLDHEGVIEGRPVRCGSPALQVTFHLGYPPREHDRADMALLSEAFGIELPAGYLRF